LAANPDETGFNPLEEVSRAEARIIVRLEIRRFRRPVTIIQGLPAGRLNDVARQLKQRFGAGGTTKGGELMLQGDHRSQLKDELTSLGFQSDHIDIM
jgi:translation initiation factor 1